MRKGLLLSVATVLVLVLVAGLAAGCGGSGGKYPSKPINIVVPYGTGGSVDTIVRGIQPALQKEMGQTITVENREGSSSLIGTNWVYDQKPDGYNVLVLTNAALLQAMLFKDAAKFGNILEDFIPVGSVLNAEGNGIAVNNNSAFKTWDDVVAEAKKRQLTLGIAGGAGSSDHVTALMINKVFGINLKVIPYPAAGEAAAALRGGHVDIASLGLAGSAADPTAMRFVATSLSDRATLIPDVKTFKEMGYPSLEIGLKVGYAVKKGTPAKVVETLDAALAKAFDSPEFQKWAKDTKKPIGKYFNTKQWTDHLTQYQKTMQDAYPMVKADIDAIQQKK